ncbi:TIGR00341 family protein [Candidatus Leptofilum sp.]|uniref:TIGR00341 family protein n=1 Tax=Candidatus Leptofilum sp. TaxID=3241576 RepID=UPI003B599130
MIQQILHRRDSLLPKLTKDEQAVVDSDMRKNAIANIDFNLLILLSAGIAYFGLQQDSSAVIIGAMLVAPLMSPMMAMGYGIVKGSLTLFRQAAVATLIGISLAVGLTALVTYILPIQSVTDEILARTNPNLLDLFIALISGLAGAYALCRKEVSASLPGVAIAASLVPPLCVVGFGIGRGNERIALEALLLFTTNLASIVVASIFMFWAVGFRPTSARSQRLFQATTYFSLFAVLLVTIPLTFYTLQETTQSRRLAAVKGILEEEVNPNIAQIEDVVVEAIEDGFVVGMTVYFYQPELVGDEAAQQAAVEDIRRQLESAVEGPVTVRAQVIPATLSIFENPSLKIQEVQPLMIPNSEP